MTEQEQEHWDHVAGSASELQNCAFEARASLSRHNAGMQDRIKSFTRSGLFVVVSKGPWFCKAIDAIVGESITVEATRPTRAEAQAKADALNEELQGEVDCSVLPVEEKQELAAMWAARPVETDDCPF